MISKWYNDREIRVWATGKPSYIAALREVLSELSEILHHDIKEVGSEEEANVVALVGVDKDHSSHRWLGDCPPALGCAAVTGEDKMVRGPHHFSWITAGAITIWDSPVLDANEKHLRGVIRHELLHALIPVGHSREVTSLMSNSYSAFELTYLDKGLFGLYAHPLVEAGMTMSDVEALIVFRDDLLDTPAPPEQNGHLLIWNAILALREAGSASFLITNPMLGCRSTAEPSVLYHASGYTGRWHYPQWMNLGGQSAKYWVLHSDDREQEPEFWKGLRDGSAPVETGAESEFAGNSREFDLHWNLAMVFENAKSDGIRISDTVNGLKHVQVKYELADVERIVNFMLDPDTFQVRSYWKERSSFVTDFCDSIEYLASEDRYGIAFEFPDAILVHSTILTKCADSLGLLSGTVTVNETWGRLCVFPAAEKGFAKDLTFLISDYSLARFQLWTRNGVLEVFQGDSAKGPVIARSISDTGKFAWLHHNLAPGEYTVKVSTEEPRGRGFSLRIILSENPAPGVGFLGVSAGSTHTCGVTEDNAILCWGDSSFERSLPPRGNKFAPVSSGILHTCALQVDGIPVCWGDDGNGRASPPVGETFSLISAGAFHACALRLDGTPVCWGFGRHGQLSPPQGEKFTTISSSWSNTCGLRDDGTAVCWGTGINKVYGHGSPPKDKKFTSLSCGTKHSCGLGVDGTVTCWGSNTHGQSSRP